MNLERLASIVQSMKVSKEWLLIDPQGRAYRGEVAEITQVLMLHHPLLKPFDISVRASTPGDNPAEDR